MPDAICESCGAPLFGFPSKCYKCGSKVTASSRLQSSKDFDEMIRKQGGSREIVSELKTPLPVASCDSCRRSIPDHELRQAPMFGDRRSLMSSLQAPEAPMQCTGCGVWLCCRCLNIAHTVKLASGEVHSSLEGLHHVCDGYFEYRKR